MSSTQTTIASVRCHKLLRTLTLVVLLSSLTLVVMLPSVTLVVLLLSHLMQLTWSNCTTTMTSHLLRLTSGLLSTFRMIQQFLQR